MQDEQNTSTRALGCDGGGSGCRMALIWDGARFEVVGGPANVSTDRRGAEEELAHLLSRVTEQAGLIIGDLAQVPAYFGLAGIISEDMASALARSLPLERLVVEEDRRAAVRGALGPKAGFVAGIGTGSYLARQGADQSFVATGGHGLVLGDEASGAWAGREALRAVLAAEDGLTPGSPLTKALRHEFGGPAGIIAFAGTAQPADFAKLAPRIFDAEGKGDAAARYIVVQGADYIARGLLGLGWREGDVLCLAGGLGPSYGPHLPDEMQAALVPAEASALDGALALAKEAA